MERGFVQKETKLEKEEQSLIQKIRVGVCKRQSNHPGARHPWVVPPPRHRRHRPCLINNPVVTAQMQFWSWPSLRASYAAWRGGETSHFQMTKFNTRDLRPTSDQIINLQHSNSNSSEVMPLPPSFKVQVALLDWKIFVVAVVVVMLL